jgi:hypothetical protein
MKFVDFYRIGALFCFFSIVRIYAISRETKINKQKENKDSINTLSKAIYEKQQSL